MNRGDFAACHWRRDLRFQAGDDAETAHVMPPGGDGGLRQPELTLSRKADFRRHDANDGHGVGMIEKDGAPQHRRIAAEALLPEFMAEHDSLVAPGSVFLRQKTAPE